MYDVHSKKAEEFIDHNEVLESIANAKKMANDKDYISGLLKKASEYRGLSHREAAALLFCDDPALSEAMFCAARDIKEHIYGKRIVLFAPLYLSNYCVNGCLYCGYHHGNTCLKRRKLTQDEVARETEALIKMGHKRLALEAGEDPVNNPIEYIIDCIKTVYATSKGKGEIRRVNVNIAATTVENYRRLKEAGIGTYILFQETYHKERYEYLHPTGPKHNYAYHTEAMDRAMEGGIDDVGVGALFGIHDPAYELIGLLMHKEHLEAVFGVGPHTISVPRIRKAEGVELSEYPDAVSDELFKKIVAILRLAVPYTGIILSTRERAEFRREVIKLGVSQVSGGSCTGVGGYCEDNQIKEDTRQFEIEDNRTLDEVLCSLLEGGYIPSFCTACYREGRTGERFMALAKNGQIGNVCQPNALLTLKEYLCDFASKKTREAGEAVIQKEVERIPNDKVRALTKTYLSDIDAGKRDFRF